MPTTRTILLGGVLAIGGVARAQSGGVYDLTWSSVDGGGVMSSTGGVYAIAGTIGQPDAGAESAGAYGCGGGFWHADAVSCYANCDNSTTSPVLNVLDFSCFLNMFAAGDPYANCDSSTTPPVLNVLDFSCFLNRFAAGCS
jgi:hypothetical protein